MDTHTVSISIDDLYANRYNVLLDTCTFNEHVISLGTDVTSLREMLRRSIVCGHTYISQLIIEQGLSIDEIRHNKILRWACAYGRTELVSILLRNGLHKEDIYDCDGLGAAIITNRLDTAKHILTLDLDQAYVCDVGCRLVSSLAQRGQIDIIMMLLGRGLRFEHIQCIEPIYPQVYDRLRTLTLRRVKRVTNVSRDA